MAGPREEEQVESGFWGDGMLCAEAVGSGSFSGEVDRLGWVMLGEISWRGSDGGRRVCEDSLSGLL